MWCWSVCRSRPTASSTARHCPSQSGERNSAESFVAPRSPTEVALAGIWCEVLGVEKVGIHDNFFELGGHSLLVFRLINEINRRLKVGVTVPELFNNPTVEQMTRLIIGRQPT